MVEPSARLTKVTVALVTVPPPPEVSLIVTDKVTVAVLVVVVIFVSVIFYMVIPFQDFLPKLLARIALLPLIAGVSYEVIRFAAKRRGSVLAAFAAPGLWMQRITTKPPSDDQAAVAIHALEGAMALEEKQGGELVIA